MTRERLPAQIGVILCILIFSLWWYLDNQRKNNLHNLIGIKSNELSSYLEADIRSRIPALQRIAYRWEFRGGTPKAEFLQDINAYLKDYHGFQALGWVDENFYVRWIAPIKNNEKALNLNLAFEENRRTALEIARNKGAPTMTAPITLVQGGKGFIIYIPLFVNKKFNGFISAVFRIEPWLDYVFNLNFPKKEKENFKIAVQFNNEQVYAQQGLVDNGYSNWQTTSYINILDWIFSVSVTPTESFFERKSVFAPEIVAVVGVFLSFIIAVMVSLLQKTREAILKADKINSALEENIEERKRAEHEANKANQTKSDFLSRMSHELRTPLNAIIGFSSTIKNGKAGEVNPEQYKQLSMLNTNAVHLLDLINDVLDISKIEAGKMDVIIERFKVIPVLEELYRSIKSLLDKKGLKIELRLNFSPEYIEADEGRFKQVILNLLSNAIKFSESGTVIIIECVQINKQARITISDTGIGIDKEKQASIFDAFQQIDSSDTRIHQGTGLGLTISKNLVELMNGTIGVESTPSEGSTFYITLPTG